MRIQLTVQRRLSPFLLGTALSISLLGTGCRSTPEANAAIPSIPVKLETLQTATTQESSEFVGNLEAVQIVEILPESNGRIEQILVEPGQGVDAGQVIMVIKPDQSLPDYEAALAAVDIATKEHENALKQLDIAKAKQDSASSELELYDTYVPSAQMLVEEGALEQLRLDEILQEQVVSRNNLITAGEQVAAAEIALAQAEDSIRQAQAQADASLVSVQFKEVYAPISGVLDDLPVKLGDFVSTGQTAVAKVAQMEALFLNIEVPSNRSAQLRTGLTVELIDPTSKEQLATGSLTFVSPTVNTEGQTILTKARFRNPDGNLRDGQNVQARIIWETQPGLLIPTTAISQVGGKSFVFLVDDEPNENEQEVVRLSPVELGAIQGNSYQVMAGLEAGDRIAVSNILKLRDGVPIQPES